MPVGWTNNMKNAHSVDKRRRIQRTLRGQVQARRRHYRATSLVRRRLEYARSVRRAVIREFKRRLLSRRSGLMPIKLAAARFRISVPTLYRWIQERRIKNYGRRSTATLVSAAEVKRLIAA